jgi:hypothetical protein
LLDRLGAAFVAPAPRAGAERVDPVEVVAPPAIAALCRPEDVWAAGGAVALSRGGVAVVAAWGDEVRPPLVRAPAARGAVKLARSLSERGHDAAATGRLVQVRLSGSGAEAAAEAARVSAAAGVVCVIAVAGPRDERVDALLRAQDHVLVDADDAIADLALTSLATLDVRARRVTTEAPPAVRALAAAGIALAPPLRARVEEALR